LKKKKIYHYICKYTELKQQKLSKLLLQ